MRRNRQRNRIPRLLPIQPHHPRRPARRPDHAENPLIPTQIPRHHLIRQPAKHLISQRNRRNHRPPVAAQRPGHRQNRRNHIAGMPPARRKIRIIAIQIPHRDPVSESRQIRRNPIPRTQHPRAAPRPLRQSPRNHRRLRTITPHRATHSIHQSPLNLLHHPIPQLPITQPASISAQHLRSTIHRQHPPVDLDRRAKG